MIRTVWFYFWFVISLVVSGLFLPLWHAIGILGMVNAQRMLSHYISTIWAGFLLKVAGVRVHFSGGENIPQEGPVLFISNHQSNFDIPVLLSYVDKPKGFLAKIELSKIPVINSWMNKMKCVFIDRKDMRQSVKAIQKCAKVLKDGQSLVIFPEGTRSRGPEMGEFKKGILRVADKVDVPLVPVAISGTYKLMEENNNKIKSSEIKISVGPPIYLDSLSESDKVNLNFYLRNIIQNML